MKMEAVIEEGEEEEYMKEEEPDWNYEVDVTQLCRICANPNEYLIPIFQGEGLEHELMIKISKHLPIKVTESDKLPTQLCYQCASTLIAWHDMVIGCIEANEKLKVLFHDEEKETEAKDSGSNNKDSQQISEVLEKELNETEVPQTEAMETNHEIDEMKSTTTTNEVDSVVVEEEVTSFEPGLEEEVTSDSRWDAIEEDYIDGNIYSQINRKRVNDWELEDEFMSDYESDEEYSTLYSCSICKKSGMVIRDFLRHSTEHSKEERQRVLERLADNRLAQGMAARQAAAAYGFTLQSNLKSSVSLYFCMVCGQGNLSLGNLKEHSSLHPQYVESHFCNLCQRLFADEQDLSDHLEIHLDNNDLICQYCNRKFSIIEDLESHERNHHHAEYVCTVCRQKFRSREFVLSHLRNVHSTKTVCHVCDKDFKTRTLLDEHFMTHATLSVVKKLMQCFTCDYCAKKYDSAISLQRHILFLHNDRMPYICEHCGFTTYHETPLKEHLATEHAHGGKCLCYKCGLEFRNKSELDIHMDSHVDKNKCTVCGKYFEHILDLKYHMTSHSVETDNTPVSVITVSGSCENGDVFESTEKDFVFVCNHCQEIFDNEEIYAEHIKRHVPTVSCDLCEKSFKNDIALNIHLNKVHTNKFSKPNMKYRGLPFKCAKCSAGFRLEFELEDHYITHRGIKYQCHMCFEEYNLDSDLQEHLVTHDEEIDTKVETTKVKSEKSSS